jgi:hypothetical protein
MVTGWYGTERNTLDRQAPRASPSSAIRETEFRSPSQDRPVPASPGDCQRPVSIRLFGGTARSAHLKNCCSNRHRDHPGRTIGRCIGLQSGDILHKSALKPTITEMTEMSKILPRVPRLGSNGGELLRSIAQYPTLQLWLECGSSLRPLVTNPSAPRRMGGSANLQVRAGFSSVDAQAKGRAL